MKAYELYFGCKIGDQDKIWAPHIFCSTCVSNLHGWMRGKRRAMPFAIPMVWREPQDHVSDCYFCLTKVRGVSYKKRKSIVYPSLPSAIRPVLHDESLPIPPAPSAVTLSDPSSSEVENDTALENDTSFEAPESGDPHFFPRLK